jgi:hypothetical protein
MCESAGLIVMEAVRRDPVKLFALIDLVHARIVKQGMWAANVAIKFYK